MGWTTRLGAVFVNTASNVTQKNLLTMHLTQSLTANVLSAIYQLRQDNSA